MRMTTRCIPALAATAVAVVGPTACGGGGSGEVVAQVRGVGAISKATFDHWLPVEAVLLYQQYPTTAVPKGVIPDPPDYTSCITYLHLHPSQKVVEHGPKPSPAQLKRKCDRRLQELKEITLNSLIVSYWTIGAGRSLGMKANEAEARARLKEVNARSFPSGADFTRYLRLTGQTLADMVFQSKVQLFQVKMTAQLYAAVKRLPKGLTTHQRRDALAKVTNGFPPNEEWATRTTCRDGYVVSACKQYKGSQPPGTPN
jgi:hypothetical protein